jgi:hypothetical protein
MADPRALLKEPAMSHRMRIYALLAAALALSGCILSLDRQLLAPFDGGDDTLSDTIEAHDAQQDDQDPDPDGLLDPEQDDVGVDEHVDFCAAVETACGDGLDEDCDGAVDCADDDCTGSACNDGDICTYDDKCVDRLCSGTPVTCVSETCITRTCNGTSECAVTYNDGSGCDDGEPCTYNDLCSSGSCRGTTISCVGDACISRTCNGTSSCTVSYIAAGTACPADTNACTQDVCDGAGNCTHPVMGNGASCGAAYEWRCCGGTCVNIFTSDANCGGCGITCQGRGCAIMPGTSYAGCHCVYNSHCQVNGPGWTCWDPGTGGYCNCQAHSDCAAGQVCEEPSGHNWCHY